MPVPSFLTYQEIAIIQTLSHAGKALGDLILDEFAKYMGETESWDQAGVTHTFTDPATGKVIKTICDSPLYG